MTNSKLLAHWDAFEGDHAIYQDVVTEYLTRCGVTPYDVLLTGENFRSWQVTFQGGVSTIFRFDVDAPGKLSANLEVCAGIINPNYLDETKTFLLKYNRNLYDLKVSISNEGHVIGTFVAKIDNVKLAHFQEVVETLVDFGEHLQAQLIPFKLLPLSSEAS